MNKGTTQCPKSQPRSQPWDLFKISLVKAIVKSRFFPGVIQTVNLVLFLALIYFGFFGVSEASRYTNLASFLIWIIWWPSLVFTALLAARFWCTVCPLRLITQQLDSLGWQVRVPPVIKKYRFTLAIGLFLIHSIVISYKIDQSGKLSAIYMAVLLATAVFTALIFELDSFCKVICPLNGFIGTYAKISPTELRVIELAVCKGCRTHNCLKNCPNDLHMAAVKSNESCLLCFECVKHCPHDNIRFSLRQPLQDLWNPRGASLTNLLIITILLGIIIQEVGEEWETVAKVITFPATFLSQFGIPNTIFGYLWIESVWVNFMLPASIILLTASLIRIITRQGNVIHYARIYAAGFVPLIFSLHLSKMWHNFNSKFGYSQYLTDDPYGNTTAAQLAANLVQAPAPLVMSKTVEGFFLVGLVILGLLASIYVIRQIAKTYAGRSMGNRSALAFAFTTACCGAVFLSTIAHWFKP